MRLLAIGDVHGCATALKTLVRTVRIGRDDTLVMLGDYVDRGPDTKGVLDFLIELRSRTRLITLMGNHEALLLESLDSYNAQLCWLLVGGSRTLHSYRACRPTDIPPEHLTFIRDCVKWHETEQHFFVHANALPELDLADQDDTILLWTRFDKAPPPHKSGRTMICGHTPQSDGIPRNWGSAICIDTGAGYGHWLTCLDVHTGRYWQADEKGRTRMGFLKPCPTTDEAARGQ